MKADLKTLFEIAGVDKLPKAKALLEAKPDLSKKSNKELQRMLDAANAALKTAPEDTKQESDAEALASHIEDEFFKRSKKK